MRLENQLTKLTSLVRQLVVWQHHPSALVKVCGICTSMEHPIDMCPTLHETELDNACSIMVVPVALVEPTTTTPSQQRRTFPLVSVLGYKWLSGEVEAYRSRFTTPVVVARLVKQVSITPTREADLYLVEPC
ncbi:hypothetical protein CR513_26847, partial [Mucuna pruriens]